MNSFAIVFVGAGLGGCVRHAVNLLSLRLLGQDFPLGTLLINVSGSLVMGLFAGYFTFRGEASQAWRVFLTAGVVAGYTTFSTFTLDIVLLFQRGAFGSLLLYLLGSVGLSVCALTAGLWISRLPAA